MKSILKFVGFMVVAVIALGFYVQVGESIPDHALVRVRPSQKSWIPDSKEASERLDALSKDPGTRSETLAMIEELEPTNYGEIRRGRFKGFRLAPGWGSYTDTYVTGYSTFAIRAYVYPPKSRWNQDGSWNW